MACALTVLLALTASGTATAKTSVSHFTVVGPGMQALWYGGTDVAGNDTTTNLLVFEQLNAPGTQGYFREVLIWRFASNEQGDVYQAVYDTYGSADPSVAIRQPLAYGSASGTIPLVDCTGACDGVPTEVAFSETWTPAAAITRIPAPHSEDSDFSLDPGVLLDFARGVDFFRPATLGVADPFGGAFGSLGTLSTSDPGVRFFDVHIAAVTVCHPGAC